MVGAVAVTTIGILLALVRWEATTCAPASERGTPMPRETDGASTRHRSAALLSDERRGGTARAASGVSVELASQREAFYLGFAPATEAREPERTLERHVDGMAMTNLPAAVRWLHERGLVETNRVLNLRLVRRWAEVDSRATADWLTRHSTGATRLEELVAVATVWGERMPRDAAEWARELADLTEREHALLAVGYEMARTEARAALVLADDLPAGSARDELLVHASAQWAARDPRAAAEWAGQLPAGVVRERALAMAASAWAESDPIAAATFAISSLAPGEPLENAIVGIVQRWAQKEPARAAAWVTSFPESTVAQAALEEVVRLWADRDIEQTSAWLAELPAGHRLDSASAVFAGKLAARFPDVATEWASHIGDAALRQVTMESVGAMRERSSGTAQ